MTAPHNIESYINISQWLDSLVDLTRAGSEAVTAERILTYSVMLIKDGFPPEAFTAASLHYVVQGQRFFPAYDDVRIALHRWWNDNKPRQPVSITTSGKQASLTGNDCSCFDLWCRRGTEMQQPGYQVIRGSISADRENLASLIRKLSPKAWAVINGHESLPTLD